MPRKTGARERAEQRSRAAKRPRKAQLGQENDEIEEKQNNARQEEDSSTCSSRSDEENEAGVAKLKEDDEMGDGTSSGFSDSEDGDLMDLYDEDGEDDSEDEGGLVETHRKTPATGDADSNEMGSSSSSADEDDSSGEEASDEDRKPGATETTAFGRAFRKIMKKKLPSNVLTDAMGPMLSAHKQLVTRKLEEAAAERKAKAENKKEKQELREKGHMLPSPFPVAKDKELIKLATRGVVKLFNAVSRAQSVQEAAKASKDTKEVAKQSKSTFLAMLQGGKGPASESLSIQGRPSDAKKDVGDKGQPDWSALRDTFMLGKSRLKDWDKKQDETATGNGTASSSDESLSE